MPTEDVLNDDATLEAPPNDGRRALLGLLGVFGAAALAGCATAVERGESLDDGRGLGATALADTLASNRVKKVDSVLGAAPSPSHDRPGILARNDAASIGAEVVVAEGCRSPNDGGGGLFVWNGAGGIDDGGTIIVPGAGADVGSFGPCWQRVFSGPLDVRWFGAVGDGITDDHAALANAIAAAALVRGVVWLPPMRASYVCGAALLVPHAVTIRGGQSQGFDRARGGTILLFRGAGSGFVFAGVSESALEDMQLQTDGSAGPVVQVTNAGANGLLRFSRLRVIHENPNVSAVAFGAPGAGIELNPCAIASCTFLSPAAMAAPLLAMYGQGGGLNNLSIRDCELVGAPLTAPTTRPLIHVEATDSGLIANLEIGSCIFEIPIAGAVHFYSVSRSRIVNCWAGDLQGRAPTAPLFKLVKAPVPAALACKQIVFEGLQTDIGQSGQATIAFDGLTVQGLVVVGSVVPWVDNGGAGGGLTPVCNIGSQIFGYTGDAPVGLGDSGTLFTARAYATDAQHLTLHNGLNSNATTPSHPFGFVRVAGNITSSFALGGIASTIPGLTLRIYNPTRFPMTLVDEDVNSAPANRIRTLRGEDVLLRSGASFATLLYDGEGQRWILESTN